MPSVDLGIALIDRLAQVLSVRRQNRETYFREHVEPMYRDAECIINDYTALFAELIAKLQSEEDVYGVTVWLQQRRLHLQPLRAKMRAFLAQTSRSRRASMDTFQKGIWGLMRGSLSLAETGHTQMHDYGWGGHTVLDLLCTWYDQPIDANRIRYVRNAKEQLASLQRAWDDVVRGYAELKAAAFP